MARYQIVREARGIIRKALMELYGERYRDKIKELPTVRIVQDIIQHIDPNEVKGYRKEYIDLAIAIELGNRRYLNDVRTARKELAKKHGISRDTYYEISMAAKRNRQGPGGLLPISDLDTNTRLHGSTNPRLDLARNKVKKNQETQIKKASSKTDFIDNIVSLEVDGKLDEETIKKLVNAHTHLGKRQELYGWVYAGRVISEAINKLGEIERVEPQVIHKIHRELVKTGKIKSNPFTLKTAKEYIESKIADRYARHIERVKETYSKFGVESLAHVAYVLYKMGYHTLPDHVVDIIMRRSGIIGNHAGVIKILIRATRITGKWPKTEEEIITALKQQGLHKPKQTRAFAEWKTHSMKKK